MVVAQAALVTGVLVFDRLRNRVSLDPAKRANVSEPRERTGCKAADFPVGLLLQLLRTHLSRDFVELRERFLLLGRLLSHRAPTIPRTRRAACAGTCPPASRAATRSRTPRG